jgi:putative ABC transport system ATP-binding protein
MEQNMLVMRDIVKTYGSGPAEVHALRGVDLSVKAGSMVAVMGPAARASPRC